MRFQAHDNVDNRKLLWHGTNVAVVAAILKGGLRIMPHSGGRVGSGIYFASENGKSAAYGKAIALKIMGGVWNIFEPTPHNQILQTPLPHNNWKSSL